MLPLMILLLLRRRRRQNRKRRYWIHPTIALRNELGECHRLVMELRSDPEKFFTYFRMTPVVFDELLLCVEQKIKHQDTNYRKSL